MRDDKGMFTKNIFKVGDIIGNNITFLYEVSPTGSIRPRRTAMFRCHCGKEFKSMMHNIKSQSVMSCGCLTGKKSIHNLSNHVLYSNWNSMKQRCYNPKDKDYQYYGWFGIGVCSEWRYNFKSFYDWMINNGWRYNEDLTIDRIDSDKDYKPSNCRIIPRCINSKKAMEKRYE